MSVRPQNLNPAITLKTVWSLLMKLGNWIDEKVDIMHVLLFCSSTKIFLLLFHPEVSVPLTHNGRHRGSCDNLNTVEYFLMKLNKWIDGMVEIMHILSFFCYDNLKFPLAYNGKKWILQ